MKKFLRKNIGINSVLLCASLLIACVLGEFILRTLGYYGMRKSQVMNLQLVDDAILDYRLKPNSSWIYNQISYNINTHGWRDSDHKYEKPPHTVRIVVLGDSVTQGYGVNLEATYAKQLERQLNQNNNFQHSYEVIIIALEGLNTEQEAHLLEIEGVKYDPDLVIIGYILNDPANGNSLKQEQLRVERQNWLDKFKQLAAMSSLIHYTYKALKRGYWSIVVRLGKENTEEIVSNDAITLFHHNPGTWNRVKDAFKKIQSLAKQKDIPVILMIFPVLHKLDRYPWKAIHQQVTTAAHAHNFKVLDLLAYYQTYRQHELQVYNRDNIHPNTLGHRIASEALSSFLQNNHLHKS